MSLSMNAKRQKQMTKTKPAASPTRTTPVTSIDTLVMASGNAGKLKEFDRLLMPLGVKVVSQSSLGVAPAEEPHDTFLENALAKARHASEQTGLPALADDSGICVPALHGLPGVRSARYATPVDGQSQDALNNAKLVQALQSHADKRAYYVAVLVLVLKADDPLPVVAQGLWHGEVISSPQGTHGFGYDPHFWLPGMQATAAELDPAQKNQISHRALAMQSLMGQLTDRGLVAAVAS